MSQNSTLTKNDLKAGSGVSLKVKLCGALIALALAGAAGWYFIGSGAGKTPAYRTEALERGDLRVTVTANGTLNPVRTVSIGSELSGIVQSVLVDVNSSVKAGDTLIELDKAKLTANVHQAQAALSSAKASLAQAEATLAEATAKMRRYEELNKTSGGQLPSRTELDVQRAAVLKAKAGVLSAKAAIEDAQATLETRRTDLSKASIKSPVDGVVLARSVEPGYAVAASLQAVELLTVATDLRELELQVDVDEADVGQVHEGQRVSFTVASYPNKHFKADLTKIAFGASDTTDNVVTYTTYLMVKNPQLALRPGMTATATIETAAKKNVLLVPNTALRFQPREQANAGSGVSVSAMMPPMRSKGRKSGKQLSLNQSERTQTVYVVGEDGRAQPRKVVTGLTDGRMTEIVSSDFKEGDKVIIDQLKARR
ncbi:MAG: efflux RND transporter periplasmic adaptor subunit [Duodenibacillus sp.]